MSRIKLTAYIKGVPTNIDRDMLPKDKTGRPYEYIIDQLDENGIYKKDEEYYKEKDYKKQLEEIDKWFNNSILELNKEYSSIEIELFPILEKEAKDYIDLKTHTPTIDYILKYRKEYNKNTLSQKIIFKSNIRRMKILELLKDKHLKIKQLTN